MINLKKLNNTLLITLISIIPVLAIAQKQPQIQEELSVRAPANIKTDGKLDEWPNKLLNAYNSTSRVYYVVSNDDNNLYFTIRGFGQRVSRKALQGGLIVTISHSVDKKIRTKAADNVTITFPTPQDQKVIGHIMQPQYEMVPFRQDTALNKKQLDSLLTEANTRIAASLKEIKITGVKEIEDTILSVYNTEGIKAKAQFIKVQPVFEIAIPLKYLGLSTANPVKFSYNIKLNVLPALGINMDLPDNGFATNAPNADEMYLENATDFWGEYILAKKP